MCASVAQWLEQQPCKLSNEKRGVDWASFKEYLAKKHSRGHAKGVFNYARKYADCLLREDFSELCDLSVEKRRNILTALSNLSEFLGVREVFKRLMKDYGLKWQTAKAEDLLISRMTRVEENGSLEVD